MLLWRCCGFIGGVDDFNFCKILFVVFGVLGDCAVFLVVSWYSLFLCFVYVFVICSLWWVSWCVDVWMELRDVLLWDYLRKER